MKFYSSGMYVRLAFAVAVHVEPEILLVDEVLAVGDEPFQRKCLDRIRRFQREGRTIVLVTHGLDTVAQLCDRAVMLDHGEVVVDGGPMQAIRAFREAEGRRPISDEYPRLVEIVRVSMRRAAPRTCSRPRSRRVADRRARRRAQNRSAL